MTVAGVLAITLTALCLWFGLAAHASEETTATVFAGLGAFTWTCRIALELWLPVRVPLFGATGLSAAIVAGSAVIIALFLVAARGPGVRTWSPLGRLYRVSLRDTLAV